MEYLSRRRDRPSMVRTSFVQRQHGGVNIVRVLWKDLVCGRAFRPSINRPDLRAMDTAGTEQAAGVDEAAVR